MKTIKVYERNKTCLSETRGKELREMIENALRENDVVEVDFSNIAIFAASYFNSNFGYLLCKLGPEEYNKRIKVTNLTRVGQNIYKQVIENAIDYFKSNNKNIKN